MKENIGALLVFAGIAVIGFLVASGFWYWVEIIFR